jgi:hypothetical protein
LLEVELITHIRNPTDSKEYTKFPMECGVHKTAAAVVVVVVVQSAAELVAVLLLVVEEY